MAKLSGGVAQINVGAATEVELSEKKERVKDAVEATKAAIEEGIIPGGGTSLLYAAHALDDVQCANEEEKVGLSVLRFALEQPLRWLAKNAGADDGYVISKVKEEMEKAGNGDYGFNALTGKFMVMTKAGIVDPLKVTRLALQNAVSVGIMALTTEAMVTDIPEKEEKTPSMPAGGGMPGGMGGMGM